MLNATWHLSREDMDEVRVVLGKCYRCLTCDEEVLLCHCKDMITFKYDPLLVFSTIAIVLTHMTISEDNNATHILRSIRHNHLDAALTNPTFCLLVVLKVGHIFYYNNCPYHVSSQTGSIITAHV